MSTHVKPDAETEERLRQFGVVAKVAIQTGSARVGGISDRVNLVEIAKEHFGLSRGECRKCVARAQILLAEIEEADRIRHSDKTLHIAA